MWINSPTVQNYLICMFLENPKSKYFVGQENEKTSPKKYFFIVLFIIITLNIKSILIKKLSFILQYICIIPPKSTYYIISNNIWYLKPKMTPNKKFNLRYYIL